MADLDEFWDGEKEIKLLDANILACPDWERLLGQLADSGAWVDFTQGLDIRLMTPEKAAALNRVKTRMLHLHGTARRRTLCLILKGSWK